MAPRANWNGFLRLSLYTCPLALYPATSESEKISFNRINKKTASQRPILTPSFSPTVAETESYRRALMPRA
jgi:non-homologous end joining protein Ku